MACLLTGANAQRAILVGTPVATLHHREPES